MSHIVATGHYLPDDVLNNAGLAATLGHDDEWILQRTGIRERRIADADTGTVALAERAARAALGRAGISSADVDLIIVATSTPDHLTPPTACEVQAAIGAERAAAFDIEAGFAGWLYALIVADGLLANGAARTALVIGADKLSTVTDRTDAATAALFGDGAGAVVLTAETPAAGTTSDSGSWRIGARSWWADGRLASSLRRPGGGSREPFDRRVLDERRHLLKMEGTRLFRHAVRTMASQARAVLDMAGLEMSDVDLVVPHQANLRILQAVATELGVPIDQVFINIECYGNTGSATVPIALDEALCGRATDEIPSVRPTLSRILLVSFGAGATAGAILLERRNSS